MASFFYVMFIMTLGFCGIFGLLFALDRFCKAKKYAESTKYPESPKKESPRKMTGV